MRDLAIGVSESAEKAKFARFEIVLILIQLLHRIASRISELERDGGGGGGWGEEEEEEEEWERGGGK